MPNQYKQKTEHKHSTNREHKNINLNAMRNRYNQCKNASAYNE